MASLNFGFLMIQYQVIDVAGPLDILSGSSKELMTSLAAAGLPGASKMVDKAIDIKFHHIGETMDPVQMTGGLKVVPTTTCDTCPPLDFLLVGGPDPSKYVLPDCFAEFIRQHVKAGGHLFTTCTGGLAIAPSGVLDGRTATTNHGVLEVAKKVAPKVNWVEKQWVEDGKIWTSGGACAGMDMMAHWLIKNYGMELAKMTFYGLDFEPRDIEGNRVLPQQHGAGINGNNPFSV
jgi:transcriptional regulator GlxA family with amidase domain